MSVGFNRISFFRCKRNVEFINRCRDLNDKHKEVQVFLGEIACGNDFKSSTDVMRVTVKIGLLSVIFKVDTGADVSIMNYDTSQNEGLW